MTEQEALAKYREGALKARQQREELKPVAIPLPVVRGVVHECSQIMSPYDYRFRVTLDSGERLYYNGLTPYVAPKLFPIGKLVAVSYKMKGKWKIIDSVYETFQ